MASPLTHALMLSLNSFSLSRYRDASRRPRRRRWNWRQCHDSGERLYRDRNVLLLEKVLVEIMSPLSMSVQYKGGGGS